MYKELACYDLLSDEEIEKTLFAAIQAGANGISVHTHAVQIVRKAYEAKDGLVIATPIDYPNGLSDTKLRNHAIISAIRQGANAIDLVVPTYLVFKERWKGFEIDVSSNVKICKDNGVKLRVMLEYRTIEPPLLLKASKMLCDLDVEYVFPSTGFRVDNFADNILAGQAIMEKTKLKVISNGNIWMHQHLTAVVNSKLYGYRIHSLSALQNLCNKTGV